MVELKYVKIKFQKEFIRISNSRMKLSKLIQIKNTLSNN